MEKDLLHKEKQLQETIKTLMEENRKLLQNKESIERQLNLSKFQQTNMKSKHINEMQELKDRLLDAEEKETEAIGKLNWVLHRLHASEARRLELEQGFGKAFIPSENVANLMLWNNEIPIAIGIPHMRML